MSGVFGRDPRNQAICLSPDRWVTPPERTQEKIRLELTASMASQEQVIGWRTQPKGVLGSYDSAVGRNTILHLILA